MQSQAVPNQNQVVVMEVVSPGLISEKIKRNKRNIRALGITETIIGLICCLLGIVVLGPPHSGASRKYYSSGNIGEGLWGGVWLVIGGVLGIVCGKKRVTPCLVNCHMAFSIVGAVFAGTMFSIAIPVGITYQHWSYDVGSGIEYTIAVLSFITIILCITSASLCCCAPPMDLDSNGCCAVCSGCCGSTQPQVPSNHGRVVYLANNQQTVPNYHQPAVVQMNPMTIQEIPNTRMPGSFQSAQQHHPVGNIPEPHGSQVTQATGPGGNAKMREAFSSSSTGYESLGDKPPSYGV